MTEQERRPLGEDAITTALKVLREYGTPFAFSIASMLESVGQQIVKTRDILAGSDYGSLPNDWTLPQIAEARMRDLDASIADYEKAEAEVARLRAEVAQLIYAEAEATGNLPLPAAGRKE